MNMQKLWRLTALLGLLLLWHPGHAQQTETSRVVESEINKLLHNGSFGRLELYVNRQKPMLGTTFGHRLHYYKALAERLLGKFKQAEATLMATQLSSLAPEETTRQLLALERARLWLDVGNIKGAEEKLTVLLKNNTTTDSVKRLALPTQFELWWQTGQLEKHKSELMTWQMYSENGCPTSVAAYAQAYLIKLGMSTGDFQLANAQLGLMRKLHLSRASCHAAASVQAKSALAMSEYQLALLTGALETQEARMELETIPGYLLEQKVAIAQAQHDLFHGFYQQAIDLLKPLTQDQFQQFPMAHALQAETHYWLGWAYYYLTGELETTRPIWQKGRALRVDWAVHTELRDKLDRVIRLYPTIPLTTYETTDIQGIKPLLKPLTDSQKADWSTQNPAQLRDWAEQLLGYQTELLHLVQFNPWLAGRIVHSPAYQQFCASVLEQVQLKLSPEERHMMAYPLLRNQAYLGYRVRGTNRPPKGMFVAQAEPYRTLKKARLQALGNWYAGKVDLSVSPLKTAVDQLPRDTTGRVRDFYKPTPLQQDALPLNVLQATCEGGHVHFLVVPLNNQLALMAVSQTEVFFELKPMPQELAKVLELYLAQTAGTLEKPSPLIPVRLYEKLFFRFPNSFRKQGLTWHIHAAGDFARIDYPNLSTELPRRTNQGLLRFPVKSYNKVKVGP